MPALNGRSFTAGHFGLELDHYKVSAYIKSVEGGFAKANVTDEAIGADVYHVKHLSTREIEPFSVELGLSGCKSMLMWIQDSWNKKFNRRSGQVAHADFNKFGQFEHEFIDALIMETAFPSLDGSSREPGYLKVKFLPEQLKSRQVQTARILAEISPQQKMWSNNCFRMQLSGVDCSKVAKIDGFTIKQGVKAMHIGNTTYPELEPTKIEFPDLSVHIALAHSAGFKSWYDQTIAGVRDPQVEKTGAIEFLTPDLRQTIFTVKLYEVGIKGFTVNRSEGLQDAIKRAKMDLYVGRMELVPGSGLA
jgi:hypothetical protein